MMLRYSCPGTLMEEDLVGYGSWGCTDLDRTEVI